MLYGFYYYGARNESVINAFARKNLVSKEPDDGITQTINREIERDKCFACNSKNLVRKFKRGGLNPMGSNEQNVTNTQNEKNSNNSGNALQTTSGTSEQSNENSNGKASGSMNLAIVGGLVGAGAGLLAKPEIGKKMIANLGESELVKVAGQEFRKTAQELLAGQAQESFKHMATGYIDKLSNSFTNIGSGKSNGISEADSQKYEEIKEENEALNDRLDRIESMLDKLASAK